MNQKEQKSDKKQHKEEVNKRKKGGGINNGKMGNCTYFCII